MVVVVKADTLGIYYYDSAVPGAFASGRAIFLSVDLLEAMNDTELKAVLAHEMWHLRHNSKTSILGHLSMVTLTFNCSRAELEKLAEAFASQIVGRFLLCYCEETQLY